MNSLVRPSQVKVIGDEQDAASLNGLQQYFKDQADASKRHLLEFSLGFCSRDVVGVEGSSALIPPVIWENGVVDLAGSTRDQRYGLNDIKFI